MLCHTSQDTLITRLLLIFSHEVRGASENDSSVATSTSSVCIGEVILEV